MTLGFGTRTKPERQEGEALFLQNLGWIERVAASLCGRYGIAGEDAEDFASWVKLRLIENDYAAFRKFRGESAITTYLTVVIASLFRDYRVERRGRWRPSAAARRLGPVAVQLEYLVHCAGYRLDQAAQELRTTGETDLSDPDLVRLFAQLPPRTPLRPVEVDPGSLDEIPAAASSDDLVTLHEAEEQRRRAHQALTRALEGLPDEDRLILRMRFWKEMSVADIARALAVPQKPLYRRVERILAQLRERLEAAGVSREWVRSLLGEPGEQGPG
ncbi:MAG TPA: sigma-70 family RNA polymerase sigma factor [Longimicrobiaceae bacterium]|nr:sigma-70 family RNA polymerase sigma factor [Longimicrobiaceae bacterium]